LTAQSFCAADLVSVEPWFDDRETQRWLGGREWPRRLLELARQSNRVALLYTHAQRQVGLLDLERFPDRKAAVAVVVSPEHRGRGVATSMLRSIFDLPEAEGVSEAVGEVEFGNTAGERCIRAAGFVRDAEAATSERFLRFLSRRDSQLEGQR
jgi:RimJ/RimL family protein N-acetyltransferase